MKGKFKICIGEGHYKEMVQFTDIIQKYNINDYEIVHTVQDICLVYHNNKLIGDFEKTLDYIEGMSGGYGEQT